MKLIYKQNIDMWSLSCDKNHVLHDTREPDVKEIRQTLILSSDVDFWEELPAAAVSPFTKEMYDAKVAELVRRRYAESEEFALQRKAINAAFSQYPSAAESAALEEFQQYNSYVDDCKQRAKDPAMYSDPDSLNF